MKTNKTMLFTLAGLALSLCASTAFAVDGKLYPGNVCVDVANSHNARYLSGSIANISGTAELALECPVVRDSGGIGEAWVKVVDRSYDRDVSCTLLSFHIGATGLFTGWSSIKVSAGANTAPQTLSYGALPLYDADGYYYFSCSIPRSYQGNQSRIATFRVNEND